MKIISIFMLFFAIFLNGCASDNAVAMNLYQPQSNDYEKVSGVTAVITQDMIDRVKKEQKNSF